MLKDNGVEVAVITARDSKTVAYRMKNLGIAPWLSMFDSRDFENQSR
jgi:3-deoxy-D-manno-octulosonate 8-phosphate phosphatase KdsC-like HAD superfamily phosphatase